MPQKDVLSKKIALEYDLSCIIWKDESVNRNSIIMISKGYHFVITLGILSNFYISIDPVYLESLPNNLS